MGHTAYKIIFTNIINKLSMKIHLCPHNGTLFALPLRNGEIQPASPKPCGGSRSHVHMCTGPQPGQGGIPCPALDDLCGLCRPLWSPALAAGHPAAFRGRQPVCQPAHDAGHPAAGAGADLLWVYPQPVQHPSSIADDHRPVRPRPAGIFVHDGFLAAAGTACSDRPAGPCHPAGPDDAHLPAQPAGLPAAGHDHLHHDHHVRGLPGQDRLRLHRQLAWLADGLPDICHPAGLCAALSPVCAKDPERTA